MSPHRVVPVHWRQVNCQCLHTAEGRAGSCRPKHPLFREQPLISFFSLSSYIPFLCLHLFLLSLPFPHTCSLSCSPPPFYLPLPTTYSAMPPSLSLSHSPLSLPSYVTQQLKPPGKNHSTKLKVLFLPPPPCKCCEGTDSTLAFSDSHANHMHNMKSSLGSCPLPKIVFPHNQSPCVSAEWCESQETCVFSPYNHQVGDSGILTTVRGSPQFIITQYSGFSFPTKASESGGEWYPVRKIQEFSVWAPVQWGLSGERGRYTEAIVSQPDTHTWCKASRYTLMTGGTKAGSQIHTKLTL